MDQLAVTTRRGFFVRAATAVAALPFVSRVLRAAPEPSSATIAPMIYGGTGEPAGYWRDWPEWLAVEVEAINARLRAHDQTRTTYVTADYSPELGRIFGTVYAPKIRTAFVVSTLSAALAYGDQRDMVRRQLRYQVAKAAEALLVAAGVSTAPAIGRGLYP